MKQAVLKDKTLNVLVTGAGKFGPDMFDLANQRWWDITTSTQWAQHRVSYETIFGRDANLLATG